ncbi:MAG: transglutaminase family protein [Pseudomonadota bacterium]
MRLSVQHIEKFEFEPAALSTIQVCRLTPRDHTGHYVCEWSVEVDADCDLSNREDAFGNIVTSFSVNKPLERLTIRSLGEIETEQHHGVVRGTREGVPLGVFLRVTDDDDHVAQTKQLLEMADTHDRSPIDRLHALMTALHAITGDDDTREASSNGGEGAPGANGTITPQQSQSQSSDPVPKSAQRFADALRAKQSGNPALPAMLLADAARLIGIPARLISGHRLLSEQARNTDTRDVWAEMFVEKLGWIGFDPRRNNCPSDESVRIAAGLNLPGISALRVNHHTQQGEATRHTEIALSRA